MRTTPVWICCLLLIITTGSAWANQMESRAKALIEAENNKVAAAQTVLDAAQAAFDRVVMAEKAPLADVQQKKQTLKEERTELKRAQARLAAADTESARRNATLHIQYRRGTVRAAFVEWERAVESAHRNKDRVAQALAVLDKAKEGHDQAIAHSLQIRQQIEEEFKQHLPPWVMDVKVTGQDGLMYHGHWIPQKAQIHRRMAAHKAFITHAPERLSAIQQDLNLAIDMANRAAVATTAAMDSYRVHVVGDALAQIGADVADLAQTLARDAASEGAPGLIVGTGVEAVRAFRSYGDKAKYWNLQRLPGLNQGLRQQLQTSEALIDLGFARESVLRMEAAINGQAQATQADAALPPGALKQEVERVMRATEPNDTNAYIEMIVANATKEILNTLSDPALEQATKIKNQRISNFIRSISGGDLRDREAHFVKQAGSFGLNVGIDAAVISAKQKLKDMNTTIREDAFRRYVGRWQRQVWLENEVIQTSRDYWALRRAVAEAEVEVDRLMGLLGSDRSRNRSLERSTNHELDNDSDFRIDITFSTDVEVTGVSIGGRVVPGRGAGSTWTGAFHTKELSGLAHIVIDARSPTSGYQLTNPYKAPLWSTEKGEFNDYNAEPDDHHAVMIEASEGSGIKVGVADTFGLEGLRVQPALGVKAYIFDDEGEEVAFTTIVEGYLTDFIPLSPGSYTLRLDIGKKYVPALPEHCTDGYVREFSLDKEEQLQFNASVYTARVANNGQTVGRTQGECIKLKQ